MPFYYQSNMNLNAINNISTEYGTPFYLFDIDFMTEWVNELKDVFNSRVNLCYAIKANPFLLPYMNRHLNHFEVCSPGEYKICLKYGIPSEKIILSGVYKSKENIEEAFDNDFSGVITLESPNHFKLLKEVISERGINNVTVLPRLTSGNKFGMCRDDIISIIKECNKLNISVKGVQYFSGTQKKRFSVYEKELAELDAFCNEIEKVTGTKVNYIEYGPGLFFEYYEKKDQSEVAKEFSKILSAYTDKYEFTLEIGRYLSASCGSFITSLVDIKHSDDKHYCLVDGGIHHVNYYGRMLGMNVPDVLHVRDGLVQDSNDETLYEVGGALCTVNDVLLRNHPLNNPKEGDILIFNNTGAYSCMESPVLFLSRQMPRIFALNEGKVTMLRDVIESFEFNS